MLDRFYRGVVLINAPAGFGKSVLVRQWAQSRSETLGPAALIKVSLTESSVIAAISHFVREQHGIPSSAKNAPLSYRETLSALRDLGFVTLILDIEDEGEEDDSRRLIADLEPLVRWARRPIGLFIACRSDSRLSTGRLGADGSVLTLGARDLAFDEEEFAQLAPASSTAASEFFQKVEGWPAATHYMLMHAGAQSEQSQKAWDPINAAVDAYCADEWLGALPRDARNALIDLSFLDHFDVDLASAIIDDTDAWRHIETFQRCGFIVERPQGGFRHCHIFFRQICERELDARGRRYLAVLAKRAAVHHVKNGSLLDALHMASRTGDTALITDIFVMAGALEIGLREGAETLNALLDILPEACFSNLQVKVAYAFGLAKRGNLVAAADLCEQIWRSLAVAPDRAVERNLLLVEIFVRGTQGIGLPKFLLGQLDHNEDLLRMAIVHNVRGVLALHEYNMVEASRELGLAITFYERAGARNGMAHMLMHRARVHRLAGRLLDAREDLQQASDYFLNDTYEDLGGWSIAQIFLAEILLQMGEPAAARAMCEPALRMMERGETYAEALETGYRTLHALELADGRTQAAEALLVRLGDCSRERAIQLGVISPIASAPQMALPRPGPYARALPHDQTVVGRRTDRRFANLRSRAWRAFRSGNRRHCQVALTAQRDRLIDQGAPAAAVEPTLDLVLMYEAAGERSTAVKELRTALILAAECQLVWPFLERATDIMPLLMVAQTSTDPEWLGSDGSLHARKILAQLKSCADPNSSLFTAREEQILLRLADNVSNKQIARELNLSPETVRFHLKSIYTKFGVAFGHDNRKIVAMLARDSGLVRTEVELINA